MAENYIEPADNGIIFGQAQAIAANIFDKIKGEKNVNERFSVLLTDALQEIADSGEASLFKGFRIDTSTEPRILSKFFNDAFEKVFIDLHALYAQANNTENVIGFQGQDSNSGIARMTAAIKKLKNDVRSYAFLVNSEEFNEVKFNNFSESRNFYGSRDAAKVDPISQYLEIPAFKRNRVHQFIGDRETVVSVESLSEGIVVSSKDSDPSAALTATKTKAWSETLLSDGPTTTVYKGTVYEGAASMVTVSFSQFETVNNIRLTPFAEYPVKIIDLEYKSGSDWIAFPGFTETSSQLGVFEFDSVQLKANAIRFVMVQETFTSNIFNVPKSMVITNLLWEQIVDEKTSLDKSSGTMLPEDYGRSETEDGFAAYLDALSRYGFKVKDRNTALNDFNQFNVMASMVESSAETMGETEPQAADALLSIATGKHESSSEEYVQIEKAEYQYGMSYMEISDVQYMPEATYESQKYSTESTVYEVTLESLESQINVQNKEDSNTHRETSIEYELEIAENKKFQLLPRGTAKVLGELINIDRRTGRGSVRFATSDTAPVVRNNGELLDPVRYNWIPASREIELLDFNRNLKYTIDYTPDPGQDTVDLASSGSIKLEFPELFDGTDENGSVRLRYFPFVVYDIVNDSERFIRHDQGVAKWTFRNSQGPLTVDGVTYGDGEQSFYEPVDVFVDGVRAFNITDYRGGRHPAFSKTVNRAYQFEYIQIGNRVYLNQVIPRDKQIQVVYSYLAKYLKINAKLRCNTIVEYPLTPKLKEYQLNLKTANI